MTGLSARVTLTRCCIAGTVALAGCARLDVAAQSVLHPGGPDAAIVTDLAWLLFAGGLVLLAGTMALLAVSLRRHRRAVQPLWWIVGGGVVLPFVVLTALLIFSTWRSGQLTQQSSQDALHVSVTARMWWWEVRYRDPVSGREIMLANELHIPVGRKIYLGSGTLRNHRGAMAGWIAGTQNVKPGARMPSFDRIDGATLGAIAAYLEHLK